ncbi:MAG: hypothetical protein PHE02_13530 [Lachnospiraceae bacterium]|nr:hypothetical protein [Lachnospiraceae bacterium]
MILLLTGCGKEDKALTQYKENMMTFCDQIKAQDTAINGIDATSDTAVTELLDNLDQLNAEFTSLAEMEVPSEFSSVETLADEAGEYMNEAVSMYRDVFTAENLDQESLDIANENYSRAMKRIQYIGDILMGQIPDGDDVNVTYEDESAEYEQESESTVG